MAYKKYYSKPDEKDRQKMLEEAFEQVQKGVQSVLNHEDYQRYLDFVSHLKSYSFYNTMLIFMQREDARIVQGLKAWNQMGRKVNKGEKAIRILAPLISKKEVEVENEKGEKEIRQVNQVYGYRFVNVFDVRQTSGKPLPKSPIQQVPANQMAELIYEDVKKAWSKHIPISEQPLNNDSLFGYYRRNSHEIVLNESKTTTEKLTTLIHEYAHSIFHSERHPLYQNYSQLDTSIKETQAESVSYVVCSQLGFDTSSFSFPYIALYAKEDFEQIAKYQGDILRESYQMIETIEEILQEKEQLIGQEYPIELESNVTMNGQDIHLYRFERDGEERFVSVIEPDQERVKTVDGLLQEYQQKEHLGKSVSGSLEEVKEFFNAQRKSYEVDEVRLIEAGEQFGIYEIAGKSMYFVAMKNSLFQSVERVSEVEAALPKITERYHELQQFLQLQETKKETADIDL